jgi:hypothetical protein
MVPMDDPMAVAEVNGRKDLTDDAGGLCFHKRAECPHLVQ